MRDSIKEEVYQERIDFTSPECAEEEAKLVIKYLDKFGVFSKDKITISQELYNELIETQKTLDALKWAGVDNWEGYDEAMRLKEDA